MWISELDWCAPCGTNSTLHVSLQRAVFRNSKAFFKAAMLKANLSPDARKTHQAAFAQIREQRPCDLRRHENRR